MTIDKILIMDDEPHVHDWLEEYLTEKGYACVFVVNIGEAIELLKKEKFRALILDLNVPAPGEYASLLESKGSVYQSNRGLYVAEYARNHGYRDRQVIVYSVHDIDEVRAQTERMRVTYVTKGRPRIFKSEIDDVLSFDPSATN